MTTSLLPAADAPLVVRRVGISVWILRLLEPLEGEAVSALEHACHEAIEQDATDLVVDLGTHARVGTDGARALAGLAERMPARGGSLWVAAAWADEAGYTLRPIHESPEGLLGIIPALDDALSSAYAPDLEKPSIDAGAGSHSIRATPSSTRERASHGRGRRPHSRKT